VSDVDIAIRGACASWQRTSSCYLYIETVSARLIDTKGHYQALKHILSWLTPASVGPPEVVVTLGSHQFGPMWIIKIQPSTLALLNLSANEKAT
jgi:hypothetical protein